MKVSLKFESFENCKQCQPRSGDYLFPCFQTVVVYAFLKKGREFPIIAIFAGTMQVDR